MFIKKIFAEMHNNAAKVNKENIINYLAKNQEARFIDLGCSNGDWTLKLAKKIETTDIYGVEMVDETASLAKQKGIKVFKENLNNKLSFDDNFFDVIHSNQVIEHISNLDLYLSEIYRILKPGGYVVVSTENNSSWHNIFASILGWQTFSSASFSSKKFGVGNPLSLHRNSQCNEVLPWSDWMHKVIFNYLGLKEFFELNKFKNIQIAGAGYYPFPAKIGRVDPRHAHFITIKAYK